MKKSIYHQFGDIPGLQMIFVGALSCTRHKIHGQELQQEGKFSYLCPTETDFITGSYLKKIKEAAAIVAAEKHASALIFVTGCQCTVLSTDFDLLKDELEEALSIPVCFFEAAHLCDQDPEHEEETHRLAEKTIAYITEKLSCSDKGGVPQRADGVSSQTRKKLWMTIPPILSDTFGFEETVTQTDGAGILDDSSVYKPSSCKKTRPPHIEKSRMEVSVIQNKEVIRGSKKKVLGLLPKVQEKWNPSFLIFGGAPVSNTIGTDLDILAESSRETLGIPSAAISLSGHYLYDYGIGETQKSIAALLVSKQPVVPSSFNVLGLNNIDLSPDNTEAFMEWSRSFAEEYSQKLISVWCYGDSSEKLSGASCAEQNLVLTVSGLPLAKWFQEHYEIPYIPASPMGESWCGEIKAALLQKTSAAYTKEAFPEEDARILILGEQLTALALRETLIRDFDLNRIQICSYYQMEKELLSPCDRRLRSEEELIDLLQNHSYDYIFADPAYRPLMPPKSDAVWIDLPHGALSTQKYKDAPLLIGSGLNTWLLEKLNLSSNKKEDSL